MSDPIDVGDLEGTQWLDLREMQLGTFSRRYGFSFQFRDKVYEIEPSQLGKRRCIAFRDQWRITEFRRYIPLIYMAALGNDHSYEMLRINLQSLVCFGAYEGDVLILSDRSADETAQFVPSELGPKCHHFKVTGEDVLDYATARYRVVEWPAALDFGPVLYVDTDVLFDAPVQPVLLAIASSQRVLGQGSAGPLWRDMGVGAHLLSDDGHSFEQTFDAPQGFCSGTLGIPNMADAAHDLRLIASAIRRYALATGQRNIGWYDQPTANYILYNLYGECPNTLVPFVRWGGRDALHGGDRPRGLVHLWGGSGKLMQMQELFALMKGDNPEAHTWVVYGEHGRVEHPDLRV